MTGTRLVIRDYRPGDQEAVIRMLTGSEPWQTLGYGRGDWEKLFGSWPGGREGYVVEQGGEAGAVAILRQRAIVGDYLELVAVRPALRGHGLGGALLAYVEQLVFARTKNLFVCVSDFNSGGRRFYEQHGYREVGPLPDLLVSGRAEILMRKTSGPVRG